MNDKKQVMTKYRMIKLACRLASYNTIFINIHRNGVLSRHASVYILYTNSVFTYIIIHVRHNTT